MEILILATMILIEVSLFCLWLLKFSRNLKIKVRIFWTFILLTFFISVYLITDLLSTSSNTSSPTGGSEGMGSIVEGIMLLPYIVLMLVSLMILVLGLIFRFAHAMNKEIQKIGIVIPNVGPPWLWFLIIMSLFFFLAFSPTHPITFIVDKIERIQKILKW